MDLEKLRYPIGTHSFDPTKGKDIWIDTIESFPQNVKTLLESAEPHQLKWPYRPDGWNVNQLVHHCLDSHMNSLVRFKWALTEDEPTIKPYFEDRWIHLGDVQTDDIELSMSMLTLLHRKWTLLLKSLDEPDLSRTYRHPEHEKKLSILETISMYAWHCEHHLAHMKQALNSVGQYQN